MESPLSTVTLAAARVPVVSCRKSVCVCVGGGGGESVCM